MKTKRIVAILLCALALVGIMPMGALAAQPVVTIESQTNSAFDYLEYYKDGSWHDLNTPRHWIEQTGEIVYCVEHAAGNPHGDTYTATAPSNIFGSSTLSGLNSILMYGYPNNTPSGFTADEARQATANAIRFWLAEQGEAESYSFTNRRTSPNTVRAKSGYEHVLEWADELLAKARARQQLPHGISFSPASVQLTASGSIFSGSTRVDLTNINSGYTLDTSELPAGASISGYTGRRSETITITVPASAAGESFDVYAEGMDTRSIDNITAYVPSSGSLQITFLCATTAQVVAEADFSVGVPAFGKVKVVKTGDAGAALSGVKFGIYSDSRCSNKIGELTTGSDGSVTSGDLPVGTVYLKELSTVSPYVLTSEVKSATITASNVATVSFTNAAAKGKIRIEKMGDVLVTTQSQETAYGVVTAPAYRQQGVGGVVFEVKNSGGTVVATLTTDASGIAETDALPLGSYTVAEKSAPAGYVVDTEPHAVTLAYKGQSTAVVTAKLGLTNELRTGKVKIRKTTESFNVQEVDFYTSMKEGVVFGLYTSEAIGNIPANALLEVLTTDETGTAESVASLPYGSYYLKELAVPDETMIMLTNNLPLVIDDELNDEYYVKPIHNEQFKCKIGLYKFNSRDKDEALAGAVFEIRDTTDRLFDTITTNNQGYAESCYLPVGEYKVKEIKPAPGFILSDAVKTVKLTTEDKATATFELVNDPNSMVITKTDLTDGKPVPGATIVITDEGGRTFFSGKTDSEGQIHLDKVPAGKYTYKETVSPDGYALNTETFTFTMDEHGEVTGTTEITNAPTALVLTKLNGYTNAPFAGVEFTLKNSEGNIVKTKLTDKGYHIVAEDGTDTFTVDNNGKAEFRYLPVGAYSFVETIPAGFIGDASIPFELKTSRSTVAPLALTVTNNATGLVIFKVDADTSKPLTGAGFRIKVKKGLGFGTLTFKEQTDGSFFCDPNGTLMDLKVDANGKVTVYGLPLGDIWIEESIVPEGYFPIAAARVELLSENTSAKPYEITIKNSRYVKLGMDSDWWEFPAMIVGIVAIIGGATFFVIKRRKLRKVKD